MQGPGNRQGEVVMIVQCLRLCVQEIKCMQQTTVNDTADTVWRRKSRQSDVVAKVALLMHSFPSGGGGDDNAMPQCTGYVYKRLGVCNRPL